MTPEEYIKAYTRGCSNELVDGGYHEWLTPENALAAVELAREEKKEPASDDLERCVVEQMEADGDVDDFVRRGIDDIASKYAQLGAQWQKEQMMKDAIEVRINRDRLYNLKPIIHEKYLDYKIGDKVKIIIIKE